MSGVEADATALVLEQEQDPTLANCWIQAQAGKGGFLTNKGLLYHKDQVEGQAVCQLCVPQGRRAKILQLAHESVLEDTWVSGRSGKGSDCMDCIGPLDPVSAQGHKYCLCIVDSCTRWPSVYMLKSLTAKAVWDALVDLFTRVGVPKVMVSDCGTNFTSQLTQEMLCRLGCSLRFNTPGHPEASGMVGRFN